MPRADTAVLRWFCASCGAEQSAANNYCASCGAQAPTIDTGLAAVGLAGAGPTPPAHPPAAPKPKPGLGKTPITIIAVLALIVLAGGGAVAYLLNRSSSSPKAKPAAHEVSIVSQVRTVETSASNAQRDLISAIHSVTRSGGGLAQVRRAAQALDSAVSQARTSADSLTPSSSSERADLDALNQLLSDQAALAGYLENIPATANRLSQGFIAPLSDKADAVNSSAAALSRLLPGAAPDAIDAHAWTSLDKAAAQASRQAAIRTFLVKIENLLSQSASGRSQLATALSQTEDHCAISPDDAAQQFHEVANNRQSVLDQLSALTVPQSGAARNLLNTFQDALRHSIAADNAFASWMTYLYSYYYEYPIGCPGEVPTDSNYDRAVSESSYASAAKARLASQVNRLARPYGLRANWTSSEI
jgi:hypothetical protein